MRTVQSDRKPSARRRGAFVPRRAARLTTALVASGLLLAGCTSSLPPESMPTQETSEAPAPTAIPQDATLKGAEPRGEPRDSSQCAKQAEASPALEKALQAVNGKPVKGAKVLTAKPADAKAQVWDSAQFSEPLHVLALDPEGTGLATPQELEPASANPAASVGLATAQGFKAFPSRVKQGAVTAYEGDYRVTPLAGMLTGDLAVWREQRVPSSEQLPTPSQMSWRVLAKDLNADTPAVEVVSSSGYANTDVLPANTPWRGPVTDGNSVYTEATVPTTPDQKEWEQQILQAPADGSKPATRLAGGRLPTAQDNLVAWVEDDTGYGLDYATDRFRIRFKDDAREAIVLDTGDFFKVQWIELVQDGVVVVLQDRCSARSWVGFYSFEDAAFKAWTYQNSDGIAMHHVGDVIAWGNGSGSTGPQIYRWDVTTENVEKVGENPGFSVPFASRDGVAVPYFRETQDGPFVAWKLQRLAK